MAHTMGHQELFGHLATDAFTAQEAAEYLEVSISTFRRFVASGKVTPQLHGRTQPNVQGACIESIQKGAQDCAGVIGC